MPKLPFPEIGEVFELSVPAPGPSPWVMLREDLIKDAGWDFAGTMIAGPATARLKLVRAGPCDRREHVEAEIGRLSSGLWRDSFLATFEAPPAGVCVGFGDTWLSPPTRREFFPFIAGLGHGLVKTDFRECEDGPFNGQWVWLVPASPSP